MHNPSDHHPVTSGCSDLKRNRPIGDDEFSCHSWPILHHLARDSKLPPLHCSQLGRYKEKKKEGNRNQSSNYYRHSDHVLAALLRIVRPSIRPYKFSPCIPDHPTRLDSLWTLIDKLHLHIQCQHANTGRVIETLDYCQWFLSVCVIVRMCS